MANEAMKKALWEKLEPAVEEGNDFVVLVRTEDDLQILTSVEPERLAEVAELFMRIAKEVEDQQEESPWDALAREMNRLFGGGEE